MSLLAMFFCVVVMLGVCGLPFVFIDPACGFRRPARIAATVWLVASWAATFVLLGWLVAVSA